MLRQSPSRASRIARKSRKITRIRRASFQLEPLESRYLLAVVNWINPGGGDWSVVSNWLDDVGVNRLPGPGDDAVINVAGGATVTHSTNATELINSLSATSPLRHSAGVLDIASTLSSSSAVVLAGGTLRDATTTAGTNLTTSSGTSTLDGVTVGAGSSLVLSSGDGFFNNVNVVNGLTVDGQATVGFLGRLLVGGSQMIDGTGELILNDSEGRLYLNQSGMTLTFGPDLTVRGGLAPIGNNPNFPMVNNTTLINHGTIRSNTNNANAGGFVIASTTLINAADGVLETTATGSAVTINAGTFANQGSVALTAGTFSINSASWSNTGEINLFSGTLNLGGNFRRETLGTLHRSGGTAGTVQLRGTLDNSDDTLLLNTGAGGWGSWILDGGRIVGGTITTRNGAQLLGSNNLSSTLDGVTLSDGSDLVLSSLDGSPSRVNVINGLTLDGKLTIGSIGRLLPTGTQTFDGHGEIVFTASTSELLLNQSNMTLTLGPSLSTHGREGNIGNWLNFPTATNTTIVNQGSVQNDFLGLNGGITIGGPFGNFTNGPNWINTGSLRSRPGATLRLQSPVAIDGSGILDTQVGGTLVVHRNLTGTTTNADHFRPRGVVQIDGQGNSGTPRLLEAMSRDVGNGAAGFDNNFAFGPLALTNNATARLIDGSDNAPGVGSEAVYAQSLSVAAGSTLDLNGLNLYTRAAQISGTVIGGTVTIIPAGGNLLLGIPTPGSISAVGQTDTWTFFGRSGQSIRAVGSSGPGSSFPPFSPSVDNVQIQVVDPSGSIIATADSASFTSDATLSSVNLPVDGVYQVRIKAVPHSIFSITGTGNYVLTVSDATVRARPLILNQRTYERLPSIYATDQWTFSAAANQQVQLDRISAESGLLFDLTGPSGFVGFTGLTTSSGLVTLPTSGLYTLKVRSSQGADGAYAFRLNQTGQTTLALGTDYHGVVPGSGSAQLFRVDVPSFQPLTIQFDGQTNSDRIEVYARQGTPPTRQDFDFRNDDVGADHQVGVPYAIPGTWYVLIYGDALLAPNIFALRVDSIVIDVLDVAPHSLSNSASEILTVHGLGFLPGTVVELLPQGGGTALAANEVFVDSTQQITAEFDLSSAATGVYDVRTTLPTGASKTLVGQLSVAGGTATLDARLILAAELGRHATDTLYVEYANTGSASMPAPILTMKSTDLDGSDRPLLTLDKNRLVQGLWTSTSTPDGFGDSVQIYAQGDTPGLLQPGERIQVPVYYAGLQAPFDFTDTAVEFGLFIHQAGNTDTVNWPSLEAELKPDWMNAEAWPTVYLNLQAQVGQTWGDYVQMLSDNAVYLQRLGQRVTSVERLYSFEMLQAMSASPIGTVSSGVDAGMPTPGLGLGLGRSFGNSINERYRLGPFGRGWNATTQRSLEEQVDGTAIVHETADEQRRFQPDSRGANSYFGQTGDTGKLLKVPGVGFELTESDGILTRFHTDGTLDFVRDPNGNMVTAGYASGRMSSLTHSSGASLAIAYNGAGRITSVTDTFGRATSYTYDVANEHLLTVTDASGTTTFTYSMGQGAASEHAITSVTDASGTTQYFTYDNRGRLTDSHLSGNLEPTTLMYGDEGQVTITDSVGVTSELFFDGSGFVARAEDANGFYVRSRFDERLRLIQVEDALGRAESYSWTRAGAFESITDALNQKTVFTSGGPINQPKSFTDARGNVTQYNYDVMGNMTATTYADATIERTTYDTHGTPDVLTNRRGQTVDRTVNAAGQVTHEGRSDGTFADYAYDTRGRLHTAADGSGTTTLTYDTADRLTRVEYPNGRWLQYSYDSAGRRTRIDDQAGFATNYDYDETGRLHRLRDASGTLIIEYTYDLAGRLVREDKGNGTYSIYAYDSASRTTSIVHRAPNGSVNSEFIYAYDAAGRRVSQQTLDGIWTYSYDLTDQLTRAVFSSTNASIADQDLQYAYDSMGNRTQTILNGAMTDYAINNMNQYTAAGTTTYKYDLDGNLIEEGGPGGHKIYSYDLLNRLIRVVTPQGVWNYEYDALGNRAAVVTNGQRTEFLIDPTGLGNVAAEYDMTNSQSSSYSRGLGLVLRTNAGNVGYFDFDGIGSTSGISATAGDYLNAYVYDPFGGTIAENESVENRFKFVGEMGVSAEGNGLHFMRARYYSAKKGRFVGQDPIRVAAGDVNIYRYVGNNPLSSIDPSGLLAFGFGPGGNGGGLEPEQSCVRRNPPPPGGLHGLIGSTQYGLIGSTQYAMSNAGRTPFGPQSGAGKAIDVANNFLDFKPACPQPDKPPARKPPAPKPPARKPPALAKPPTQPPKPPASEGPQGDTRVPASVDPNEKFGASGFGPQAFIAESTAIPYRINFENLGPGTVPTPSQPATAPAQRVVVTDQLSADLDWNTFEFTEFGFGDTVVALEDASAYAFQSLPMSYNDQDFNVDVELSFDSTTGWVRVVFQSINPDTELPPDVLTGFLPPEDGTGRGKGHIGFLVQPKAGLATGTELRNVALIRFDVNEVIATNQIDPQDPSAGTSPDKEALNTIDAGLPTSSVAPLPGTTSTADFLVTWSGADDLGGSGIAGYDVFVSVDAGPFTLWQDNATATFGTYSGAFGHTYSFFSVAADNVGHVEPPPQVADASTQLQQFSTTVVTVESDFPAGSIYGQSVTFTATVTASPPAGTPSGTVQFQIDSSDFGPALPLAGGAASISTSTLTTGNHAISVIYVSDSSLFEDSSGGPLSQFVAPAPLVITADDLSKPYGTALPTLTASYSGFVNGDGPGDLTTPPILSTTATAASHVQPGGYPVLTSGAASSNYSITYGSGTLTITPVPLIITADDKAKVYGDPLSALTANYIGLVNGDTPAHLTVLPTLTTTATASSHVGVYPILVSGAASSDYVISYFDGTLDVTRAPLTITADDKTKGYGDPLPALTVSFSGFVNGDTSSSLTTQPTLSTSATAASHVAGNPYAIAASGAVLSDYSISYVNGSLSVTPAPLTITVDNQSMVSGSPVPPLTASYSGFVNGETPASLTTLATLTTTATSASLPGVYPIHVSGATSTDYVIQFFDGSLVVTSSTQNSAFLASDPLSPSQTALFVFGTNASDVILLMSGPAAGDVTVRINNVPKGTFRPSSRIVARGLSGNDLITTSENITLRTWLYGDDGNDVLTGGAGSNILLGGNGNDLLYGGRGRAILIGGATSDLLTSGRGETIMIGGSTNHDANDHALQALLNEWSSSASYTNRVNHIIGQLSGGLNGAYRFDQMTVDNDQAIDALVSLNARDLFFQAAGDQIVGRTNAERVIQI